MQTQYNVSKMAKRWVLFAYTLVVLYEVCPAGIGFIELNTVYIRIPDGQFYSHIALLSLFSVMWMAIVIVTTGGLLGLFMLQNGVPDNYIVSIKNKILLVCSYEYILFVALSLISAFNAVAHFIMLALQIDGIKIYSLVAWYSGINILLACFSALLLFVIICQSLAYLICAGLTWFSSMMFPVDPVDRTKNV
jgi:hypothetical protein